MYNIKIYDKDGAFKSTLSEKEIDCNYSFSATVKGGFGSLSFDYYGNNNIAHRDRVKIYKEGLAIYQGYITNINISDDKKGKRKTIKSNGLVGLLASQYATDGTKNNDPAQLIRNLLSGKGFDLSGIKDFGEPLSLKVSSQTEQTYLYNILKNVEDCYFFIDENNKVFFDSYGTEKHILTFGKDCYSIQIQENSTTYYNKIKVVYDGGSVTVSDEDGITKYGENYLIVNESSIEDEATAILRGKALLIDKGIKKNCQIGINNSYKFEKIKPGSIITIRNTDWIIEEKPVQKIQYNQNTATITLDSYESLEKFISNNQ